MAKRSITFPRTSDGTYLNRETGVRIRRIRSDDWAVEFPVMGGRTGYALIDVYVTEAAALVVAKGHVENVARVEIATAYDEATAENLERSAIAGGANLSGIKALDSICLRAGEGGHTLHMAARDETCRVPQVADEESETVHFWPDVDPSKTAACGVNIMRSEYTYGSPVWAEVNCSACLAKRVPFAVDDTVYVGRYGQTSAMIWKVVEVDVAGKRARVDLTRGSLLGPQWESWANLVAAKPDESRCYATDFTVEHAFDGAAFEGAGHDWEVCEKPKDDPIHAPAEPEQGMTFTAAEVRIIRAVLVEVSTAGLRAASVEPEAYDALWTRLKGATAMQCEGEAGRCPKPGREVVDPLRKEPYGEDAMMVLCEQHEQERRDDI